MSIIDWIIPPIIFIGLFLILLRPFKDGLINGYYWVRDLIKRKPDEQEYNQLLYYE